MIGRFRKVCMPYGVLITLGQNVIWNVIYIHKSEHVLRIDEFAMAIEPTLWFCIEFLMKMSDVIFGISVTWLGALWALAPSPSRDEVFPTAIGLTFWAKSDVWNRFLVVLSVTWWSVSVETFGSHLIYSFGSVWISLDLLLWECLYLSWSTSLEVFGSIVWKWMDHFLCILFGISWFHYSY